jgi:hypothetical protein
VFFSDVLLASVLDPLPPGGDAHQLPAGVQLSSLVSSPTAEGHAFGQKRPLACYSGVRVRGRPAASPCLRPLCTTPIGRFSPGERRGMGVPVRSVAVGKCYVTEIGQVRRVLEIKEAMVKYESRRKTAHGGSWGALTTISILRFARDVEREVPCDYKPS